MLPWKPYQDLFRGWNILWQNRWGYTCLGVDRLCPIRLVTCVDDSRTHDVIERRGAIRFLSLDRGTGRRTEARHSALSEIIPAFRGEIETILRAASPLPWVLVCPAPCGTFSAFAQETGRPAVCPPADLGHWLNDKANLLDALKTLGLPRLDGCWQALSESRYSELSSRFGPSFVAQLARGTSGSGTAFIASDEDYQAAGARFPDAPVWLAPDLGDLSLNINAIAMDSGVAVGYPSVQFIGLPMLGARRGMYCGNDYAATADLEPVIWHRVVEQTGRVGDWLRSLGFRGIYGLDFSVDRSSGFAYAVDLNPRWQGSTGLLTQAEYRAGRLPLAVAGLAWQMGLLPEDEILRHAGGFLEPVSAAHMSLRNGERNPVQVDGDLQPGIYSTARGVERLRDGFYLDEIASPRELLVNGGVPRQGTAIGAAAHIVRVASDGAVLDAHRGQPHPWSEEAAAALYRRLCLTPFAATPA